MMPSFLATKLCQLNFFRNLSVIMGLKLMGVTQRKERVGPNYTKLINNNDNNNNNDDDVFIC